MSWIFSIAIWCILLFQIVYTLIVPDRKVDKKLAEFRAAGEEIMILRSQGTISDEEATKRLDELSNEIDEYKVQMNSEHSRTMIISTICTISVITLCAIQLIFF